MKLYCPVLAVLFVLAVGIATGAVVDNQFPKVGETISQNKK
jgi:hypothetical protein